MPSRDEPLKTALLEAISPKIIVLCTSEYPAAARGNRKLRQRVESFGVPVYYSDEAKAITITVRPNQFRIETMTGETIQWRAGETPKKAAPVLQKISFPESVLTSEENPTPDPSE